MLSFTNGPRRSGRPAPGAAVEPHPVADEELAAEHREQDRPLHHAHEARGEVRALKRIARVLEATDEERGENRRKRVVPRERRDDDPGVAVVALLEALGVEHVAEVARLAGAAETGDPSGDAHDREHLAPSPHAGVARSPGRVADHLRLEPEAGARVQDPHPDGDREHEEEAERHVDLAEGPHRPRGCVGGHPSLWEHLPLRGVVAPVGGAVEDEVLEEQRGDVVEHQRGDDLVRVQERPKNAGDRPPDRAEHGGGEHIPTTKTRGRSRAELEACARRADRTEIQLSLAADVEEAHAERDGGRETGEGERRRGTDRVPIARGSPNAASTISRYVSTGLWPVATRRTPSHERHDERAQGDGD